MNTINDIHNLLESFDTDTIFEFEIYNDILRCRTQLDRFNIQFDSNIELAGSNRVIVLKSSVFDIPAININSYEPIDLLWSALINMHQQTIKITARYDELAIRRFSKNGIIRVEQSEDSYVLIYKEYKSKFHRFFKLTPKFEYNIIYSTLINKYSLYRHPTIYIATASRLDRLLQYIKDHEE
jgi:hypothetical protein